MLRHVRCVEMSFKCRHPFATQESSSSEVVAPPLPSQCKCFYNFFNEHSATSYHTPTNNTTHIPVTFNTAISVSPLHLRCHTISPKNAPHWQGLRVPFKRRAYWIMGLSSSFYSSQNSVITGTYLACFTGSQSVLGNTSFRPFTSVRLSDGSVVAFHLPWSSFFFCLQDRVLFSFS